MYAGVPPPAPVIAVTHPALRRSKFAGSSTKQRAGNHAPVLVTVARSRASNKPKSTIFSNAPDASANCAQPYAYDHLQEKQPATTAEHAACTAATATANASKAAGSLVLLCRQTPPQHHRSLLSTQTHSCAAPRIFPHNASQHRDTAFAP